MLSVLTIGCSDDNEPASLDKTWSGGPIQPGYGPLGSTLTLTDISDVSGRGSGFFLNRGGRSSQL